MGKLIDADKVIQKLEADSLKMLGKYHEEDNDPYYGGVLSAIQEMIKNIRKQPTAYDVDKVVKQLEEKTSFLKDCSKYGNQSKEQQRRSYETMMMYEVADLVDDLIEIVIGEVN